MTEQYMGRSYEYWRSIEKKVNEASDIEDEFRLRKLLEEIAYLRGKVSLYESRIKELYNFSTPENRNE